MVLGRWSVRCAAFVFLCGVASCEVPATQLLVGVDTDLTWGAGGAIQSVSLDVRRIDGSGPLQSRHTTALGAGSGRAQLPLWVTVVSSDDADTSAVWVEALGCATADGCTRETAVVAQRASVHFIRGAVGMVRLLLSGSCASQRCALTERCAVATGRCIGVDAQSETRAYGGVLPGRWADASVAVDAMPTDAVVPVDVVARDAAAPVDAMPSDAMPSDAIARDAVAPVDAATCSAGTHRCGEFCAPDTAVTSCGTSCDACPVPRVGMATCVAGRCGVACPTGTALCGGACAAVGASCTSTGSGGCAQSGMMACVGGAVQCSATPRTSGACTSPAGGVCNATGACACPSGSTLCGSACVTTASDAANCGGCGNACPAGQVCSMGACATVCAAGTTLCGSSCVTLGASCMSSGSGGCAQSGTTACVGGAVQCSATPRTSGSCTSPAGGVCGASGVCACAAGATLCGGTCVTTASDAANCGGCGNACPAGQLCSSGACACPAGTTLCGSACVTLGASCTSMGSGGCAQSGTTACVGGAVQCSATPRTSGSCTTPTGGVCNASGTCACPSGTALCGGACVATASDSNNCGACGAACAPREWCVRGVCTGGSAGSLAQRSCQFVGPPGCGMVAFTGGTFTQGEATTAYGASPVQTSTVGNFAIDAYEVTVARFRGFWAARGTSAAPAVLRASPIAYRDNPALAWGAAAQDPMALDPTGYNWSATDTTVTAHPMNGVDYWLAQEFCVWDGSRLPTEAEWEYAARGSAVAGLAAGRAYPWGDTDPLGSRTLGCDRAQFNYCPGADGRSTRRVGYFAATAGLFDMAGNVSEWTADNYGTYPSCRLASTNPLCNSSATGTRVVRNAAWVAVDVAYLRSASRFSVTPAFRSGHFGFRCARDMP